VSRSNPGEHLSNPAVRWFDWNGEKGEISYYDKDAKQEITVPMPFTFMLLDRLGCVGGWHEVSKSRIWSNEVKDTRQDVMVVKAFKGGTIAEGLYKDIKHIVNSAGGSFVASCYIAFKHNEDLAIGGMRFRGAALGAWMDFEKAHRADIWEKAIAIHNFTEGKKGRVTYRMPAFKVSGVSAETDMQAKDLDTVVQRFLSVYLKRTKRDQVESSAPPEHHVSDEEMAAIGAPVTADDIPF
jgi:hypothetical protein